MAGGVADVFQVVVLPPARTHFCEVVARCRAACRNRGKTSLNWFIPALVNNRVGSSWGTRGRDDLVALEAKKSRNCWRLELFISWVLAGQEFEAFDFK